MNFTNLFDMIGQAIGVLLAALMLVGIALMGLAFIMAMAVVIRALYRGLLHGR